MPSEQLLEEEKRATIDEEEKRATIDVRNGLVFSFYSLFCALILRKVLGGKL